MHCLRHSPEFNKWQRMFRGLHAPTDARQGASSAFGCEDTAQDGAVQSIISQQPVAVTQRVRRHIFVKMCSGPSWNGCSTLVPNWVPPYLHLIRLCPSLAPVHIDRSRPRSVAGSFQQTAARALHTISDYGSSNLCSQALAGHYIFGYLGWGSTWCPEQPPHHRPLYDLHVQPADCC